MIYSYIGINLYVGLVLDSSSSMQQHEYLALLFSLRTAHPHVVKIFIRRSVLTHLESWPTRKRHRVIVYFVRSIGVDKSLDRSLQPIYLYPSVH